MASARNFGTNKDKHSPESIRLRTGLEVSRQADKILRQNDESRIKKLGRRIFSAAKKATGDYVNEEEVAAKSLLAVVQATAIAALKHKDQYNTSRYGSYLTFDKIMDNGVVYGVIGIYGDPEEHLPSDYYIEQKQGIDNYSEQPADYSTGWDLRSGNHGYVQCMQRPGLADEEGRIAAMNAMTADFLEEQSN